jgi:hypothetical protein
VTDGTPHTDEMGRSVDPCTGRNVPITPDGERSVIVTTPRVRIHP